MKRPLEEDAGPERPSKYARVAALDRISLLSDELLLRILAFGTIDTLIKCQRVSRKFHAISGDSQLWKAAYYDRFVRPRASRIPGIRDTKASSEHLFYSSKLSKWLDEANLVRRGHETNWKGQYKLRDNWSRGRCAVSEIPVSEKPSIPPLLVRMHEGTVFTVDSIAGLRAWSSKDRRLIATMSLRASDLETTLSPTSIALHSSKDVGEHTQVAVGFEDGRFSVIRFEEADQSFSTLYSHPPSSNGMLSGVAYSFPYLLTMTETQLLSLYIFSSSGHRRATRDAFGAPRLLYSLQANTVSSPLSLAIRSTANSITASIAYTFPSYVSGWSVGVQEMLLTPDGQLIDSRLASAADEQSFHSLVGYNTLSSLSSHGSAAPVGNRVETTAFDEHWYAKPTSLSYSHPYLLASHPDNTLTLYLVTSTSSSLSINSGSRLWGHTSSVSGAHVGGRGKAVSVSCRGDELRVWDLEGGVTSTATRKRLLAGELSVRVQAEKQPSSRNLDSLSNAIHRRGSGLGLAFEHTFDDLSVTRGWVGFDKENVIVLENKGQGGQSLVVHDFT